MALFSRRTLAKLLEQNSPFLSELQRKSMVGRLNEGDMGCEWELAVLNAFRHLGQVDHEPSFEGSNKKLDLYFLSSGIEFLADITTVSDSFAREENPVEYLQERINQIRAKHKFPGFFSIVRVGINAADVTFMRKRQKLALPRKSEIEEEVLKSDDFKDFVWRIRQAPQKSHGLKIVNEVTNLELAYSLNGIGFSSIPSHTEITEIENNPIWNALDKKYRRQLKLSGFDGTLGIILCDGDSYSLNNPMPSWYAKSGRDVVRHFLKRTPKLGFVMILSVKQGSSYHTPKRIDGFLVKGMAFNDNHASLFSDFMENIHTLFPPPEHDAKNARYRLKEPNKGRGSSLYGGMNVKGNEIIVSARTILDLLSGQLDAESFPESYRKQFERMRSTGRLIADASLEYLPDEDDDWLTFKFGEPDVAVSPFV